MLLYKDGCFMQAIEGEALSVQQLHKRIVCDPRHGNLVTLLDGPITRREFPDWTMGFHRIEQDNLPSQPGFNHMLRTLLRHNAFSLDPALAKRLLLSFTTQPV